MQSAGKTLRYYDAEGLLVPDEIDRFTGYRYYSAARLADCNRIVALKELGFSLGEIKRRLRADSPADILALIDGKKAELEKALSQTESQLHRLDIVRRDITEGDNCMFDMLIRDADAVHVAYTRKNFDTKDEACAEIEKIRLALPAVVTGRRTVIINYETEYRERSFDLAACVEITGKPPRDCGYEEKLIAFSGDTASLVCKRGELDDAYRFMTRQLEETPCQIIGPFYEISHDDDTVELKVPVCKLSREQDRHVDDDIDLPFVNDPDAVGKWKLLDIVPSEEQFSTATKNADTARGSMICIFSKTARAIGVSADGRRDTCLQGTICRNTLLKTSIQSKTSTAENLCLLR